MTPADAITVISQLQHKKSIIGRKNLKFFGNESSTKRLINRTQSDTWRCNNSDLCITSYSDIKVRVT